MKHKYNLTIIGKEKSNNKLFISICGKWKANNLQEAIVLVKEEIKKGKYDFDFYNVPNNYNITIQPSKDVYFVGTRDDGLFKQGESNDKLEIFANKIDINEIV